MANNLKKTDWIVLGGALGAVVLFALLPFGWIIVLAIGGVLGTYFGYKAWTDRK